MRIIRTVLVLLVGLLLYACSNSTQRTNVTLNEIKTSGDFLFEGPNTLQGNLDIHVSNVISSLDVELENISSIYLNAASIRIAPDTLQPTIESALVQLVSDELSLISIATVNPFTEEENVPLSVNKEQDILNYLKDTTTSMVVDINLTNDLEALNAYVQFEITIEY